MFSILELERKVVATELCTNCGSCQGMCPYWKSEKGRTFVDYECDRNEGRCKYFCPRMPADLDALRKKFFADEDYLPEIGPFRGLYLTQAADSEIRKNAQHGGTMTALIKLALEEGFIDSAVLSKASEENGTLNPEGCLVSDPADVIKCSGSSFQIPNSMAVLNKALDEGKFSRIGVVGTPCKTLAAYKMKSKPFAENDNNADNIGMVFGLFCGWGLDWEGMAKFGEAAHVDILPGKYHRMDADDKQIDLDEVLPLVRENCKYCYDMTAEFADLSVGGARSAEGWDVDKKWNQLIIRSKKGEELFKLAVEKGILNVRDFGGNGTEGALAKLKAASESKKSKAVKAIAEKTGTADNLLYLEPSRDIFGKYL